MRPGIVYHDAEMFTGIIRHVGLVRSVRTTAAGARVTIEVGPMSADLAPGDSLAVNGVCLTASLSDGGGWADFDVIAPTLARTTLGDLAAGSKVNLERPLALDSLLDGHLVQGHVDGVAAIGSIRRGAEVLWRLTAPPELTGQMVPRGSVAVDGVSLTLAEVAAGRFTVALIPTTLARTTLDERAVGDTVNIETDVIGKYVLRAMGQFGGARGQVTLDKLRQAGFA